MKVETFFEKFEQFANAPNAVAKMRELVLELAVQGRLVADCVAVHEPRLDLSADEGPFNIPVSWNWVDLGAIAQFINGDRGKIIHLKASELKAAFPSSMRAISSMAPCPWQTWTISQKSDLKSLEAVKQSQAT